MDKLPEAPPAMKEFAMNYEGKLNAIEMLTIEIMDKVRSIHNPPQTPGIR